MLIKLVPEQPAAAAAAGPTMGVEVHKQLEHQPIRSGNKKIWWAKSKHLSAICQADDDDDDDSDEYDHGANHLGSWTASPRRPSWSWSASVHITVTEPTSRYPSKLSYVFLCWTI